MTAVTSAVAQGDLTLRIENTGKDEISALGDDFNKMVIGMQSILMRMDSVSNHVS